MVNQVVNILFDIAIFLSVVVILVFVHELGHFCLAKICKIKVERLSIGFGKPFWRISSKGGTEYVLAPIPLGGYVKLLDERERPVSSDELPFAFNQHPLYQRFAVLVAGPLFNLLFAILAFWFVFSVGIVYVKPIVGEVVPGSPAAQAGVRAKEELLSIDDKPTPHWAAVAMALVAHYGDKGTLTITVREPVQGQMLIRELHLDLRNWKLNALRPKPLESLGIIPYLPAKHDASGKLQWPPSLLQKKHYPFLVAWLPALQATWSFFSFNVIVLYKMLTGVISWQSLGGPFSILQAAVLAAGQGFIIYINFLGLLSISIAIINLLPIPGLDGAQLVYYLIELVWRKPVPVSVQVLAFRLGLILLFLLMTQALVNDLLRFE